MIRFAVILAALIGAAFLMPVSALPAGGQDSISVIYFYPRDQTPTLSISEADMIMSEIQGWYEIQVGQTFALQSAQAVRGKSTTAEYIDGGVWVPILTELGYWCGTGVHVIIVHSSINVSLGGSCDPVYSFGERGGTGMVSEANLPLTCDIELWWCGLGGAAQELGHAFSLPHPSCGWDCSNTVMWAHWLYPDVGLLDITEAPEITTLQGSVWFGDRPEPVEGCEPKFNPHGKRVGKCK